MRTAQETLDIYAPIANRLGMSKIKNELEELSFKYLDPRAIEALTAKVESRRKAAEVEIDDLKKTITAKLSEAQVPVQQVDGRLKRLYSINQKLKRQRIELDQVYDFVALRIITDSVKDCYAALGIIHQTWSPVPGRIKDFIAMPRPNGYQSLHTSVISERGRAVRGADSHRGDAPARGGRHRRALEVQGRARSATTATSATSSGCASCSRCSRKSATRTSSSRTSRSISIPEEVYIFTPKGQVKAFPRGATPVDFAYAIHTDIGHQCVGARVNGKMVPLRTRLRNGDIVEIVTNGGHKPSRDWLNFVVHGAGAQQDQALRAGGRARAQRRARDAAAGEGSPPLRSEPGDALRERGVQEAGGRLRRERRDLRRDRLRQGRAAQGDGEARAAGTAEGEAARKRRRVGRPPRARRRAAAGGEDKIKVSGIDDLMVVRARCCNPIRGEKIVGYITRGKGVSVHSATCPNVTNLLYDPERRIDVEWDSAADASRYIVRLTMQVEDRKGILADVSSTIADINTNITNVEATGADDDHRGRINMAVEIKDVKHLEKVIKLLRGVEGVLDVERSAARHVNPLTSQRRDAKTRRYFF